MNIVDNIDQENNIIVLNAAPRATTKSCASYFNYIL